MHETCSRHDLSEKCIGSSFVQKTGNRRYLWEEVGVGGKIILKRQYSESVFLFGLERNETRVVVDIIEFQVP
jgi:hypothetical protein